MDSKKLKILLKKLREMADDLMGYDQVEIYRVGRRLEYLINSYERQKK